MVSGWKKRSRAGCGPLPPPGRRTGRDGRPQAAPWPGRRGARPCWVRVEGTLHPAVTAKDIILALIARIGVGGGVGFVLEYTGNAIRALSMEARMTVCNMSIEAGAKAGMVAPDETTFAYLKGDRKSTR